MSTLLEDARAGLTASPKRMPPVWFYDREGSVLFEEITRQPEYYPTETERRLLLSHAGEIVAHVPSPAGLVELGAGSAYKTRTLIEAMLRRQGRLRFEAIDVSEEALRLAVEATQDEFPRVDFVPIQALNQDGLRKLDRGLDLPRLVLFLGSSIGNLEPADAQRFLAQAMAELEDADAFLLGIDRDKAPAVLERAYNDAAGVTARFNLNLLRRLNRELGADFDPDAFEHVAFYDVDRHRIEMHLRARRDHVVHVPGVGDVRFAKGETIHTESSYKYTDAMVDELLAGAGVDELARFQAHDDAFSLLLLRPARAT